MVQKKKLRNPEVLHKTFNLILYDTTHKNHKTKLHKPVL